MQANATNTTNAKLMLPLLQMKHEPEIWYIEPTQFHIIPCILVINVISTKMKKLVKITGAPT